MLTQPQPRPNTFADSLPFSPYRVGVGLAGAVLLLHGLSRPTFTRLVLAALGGALVHRSTTRGGSRTSPTEPGQRPPTPGAYRAATKGAPVSNPEVYEQAGVHGNDGIKVVRTIVVDRSPDDLYRFWRNFENLPRFMRHLETVRVLDDQRSHWIARTPAGETAEWYGEIIMDKPGELIAWQSLPGADVPNAGSVRFEAEGGSTKVKVALEYVPPAGTIEGRLAAYAGRSPEQQLTESLARLKFVLEGDAEGEDEGTVAEEREA